jgi:type I restriction enzyme, R subunit
VHVTFTVLRRLDCVLSPAKNDVFEGDLTPGDQISFFETVRTKMTEVPVLQAQAAANPKAQLINSPSLHDELMNAIIDATMAHEPMSRQALNFDPLRARLLVTLLRPGQLLEDLRQAGRSPG